MVALKAEKKAMKQALNQELLAKKQALKLAKADAKLSKQAAKQAKKGELLETALAKQEAQQAKAAKSVSKHLLGNVDTPVVDLGLLGDFGVGAAYSTLNPETSEDVSAATTSLAADGEEEGSVVSPLILAGLGLAAVGGIILMRRRK